MQVAKTATPLRSYLEALWPSQDATKKRGDLFVARQSEAGRTRGTQRVLPVAATGLADAHWEPVRPVGGEHQDPLGVAARAMAVMMAMPRTVAVVIVVPVPAVVIPMPLAAVIDPLDSGLFGICRQAGG